MMKDAFIVSPILQLTLMYFHFMKTAKGDPRSYQSSRGETRTLGREF